MTWVRTLVDDVRRYRKRFVDRYPLQKALFAATVILAILTVITAGVLLWPFYDRALVLSGRTEVVSLTLNNGAFGEWSFDNAVYRRNYEGDEDRSDPKRAVAGRLNLAIAPGTTVRLVRLGHGPAQLSFAAGPNAPPARECGPDAHAIGTVPTSEHGEPLCETAFVQVPLDTATPPIVIALSGDVTVGEEVSQGAGPRPLLLDATASLLVRHRGAMVRPLCQWALVKNLCGRFVAATVVLAPGNSVRAEGDVRHDAEVTGHRSAGIGFVRIDPGDSSSGMTFNLAAPAEAFVVTRLEGETFTVRESLFEVFQKSPLIQAASELLAVLGVVWFMLRLIVRAGLGAASVLVGAGLLGPVPARAQQALIQTDQLGQAMLRARGDRCYALTVNHVMGQETSALVTAPGRERGEGDLLRRVPGAPEPTALLTIRGLPAKVCPPFEGSIALDDLLQASATASLRLVRADGSIDRLPLLVGSVEVETIEVKAAGSALEQGMSGGTVFVSDRPIGLLVAIFDGGQTGQVIRLDRIFEHVAPHLASAMPTMPPPAMDGGVPYEIVKSTGAPLSPENKARSLLGDGPGPWRVAAEGPIELILRVGKPVSGLMLDVTGLADPPRSLEVLGGRSEQGPWQSLATFALEPGDGIISRRFPTVRLPFLLLRMSAGSGARTLAIAHAQVVE